MFFFSSPAQRGQGGEDERHWAAVIRVFRYGHAMGLFSEKHLLEKLDVATVVF